MLPKIVFMDAAGSCRSNTCKNHRVRFSIGVDETFGYNTLRMWYLDPKEKLEPPPFPTLSRILFIKHICEHLEAVLAKVESALPLRRLRYAGQV